MDGTRIFERIRCEIAGMKRTAYHRQYWHANARSDARKCRRWAVRLVRALLAELSRAEPWRVVDSGRVRPVRRPVLKLRRV